MAFGYFESGCGKSVSNTMWSSPIQRMTSATKRSSHSVEIQQLRRKYSVADIVSSGASAAPASSRCSSIRCSHDGSQPQPASM